MSPHKIKLQAIDLRMPMICTELNYRTIISTISELGHCKRNIRFHMIIDLK